MDKEKDLLEELEITVDEENDNSESEVSDESFDIDVKLQELYVKLDQLAIRLGMEDYTDEEYEEYEDVKKQIKELRKEKKNIIKTQRASEKKSILEQISLWIIVYGIIMVILHLPGVAPKVWFSFSTFLIDTFDFFSEISSENVVIYNIWLFILAFAIPLLFHVLSWELYINFVKTKINKWTFRIVWIIQAILTVVMIIYFINLTNLFG